MIEPVSSIFLPVKSSLKTLKQRLSRDSQPFSCITSLVSFSCNGKTEKDITSLEVSYPSPTTPSYHSSASSKYSFRILESSNSVAVKESQIASSFTPKYHPPEPPTYKSIVVVSVSHVIQSPLATNPKRSIVSATKKQLHGIRSL